jgi:glycerophosphoryl diester phosphodiesterase
VIEVIAHRGASRDAPENTLAAFALAVAQGADMIETDLRLTADGAIALCHDPDVQGAQIAELCLSALRERAPDVPTLAEVLDAFGARVGFNLELKCGHDSDHRGIEERVLEEVRRRGLLGATVFSSFHESALCRLRAGDPRARIGLLLRRRWMFRSVQRAMRLGAEAVHAPLDAVSAARVRRWRAAGLRVRVYTVDDPRDQQRLIGWGVNGLFTNAPRELRERLDRSQIQDRSQ